MANIDFAQQQAPSTATTQDYTVSGFGTPVGYMVIANWQTDAAGSTDELMHSVGYFDGTNSRCNSIWARHGITTTDCGSEVFSNRVVNLDAAAFGATDVVAIHDSYVTDGVRLDFTSVDATTPNVCVILFGGDITAAYVDDIDLANGFPSTIDETGPGFEPKIVHGSACYTLGPAQSAVSCRMSYGLCANTGAAVTQAGVKWFNTDAVGNVALTTRCSGTYFMSLGDGSHVTNITLNDFDANGFSAVMEDAAAANTHLCFIALDTTITDVHVETLNIPNATGNFSTTAAGFTPQELLTLNTNMIAVDTDDSAGVEPDGIGLGFSNSAGTSYIAGFSDDDQDANGDGTSWNDGKVLKCFQQGAAQNYNAAWVSYDANGSTFNVGNASNDANTKSFVLSVGTGVGGATTILPQMIQQGLYAGAIA